MVLSKIHKRHHSWDAKYISNFQIYNIINDSALELEDTFDQICCASAADIEVLLPAEYVFSQVPDDNGFGRACKYINDPNFMLDLNWNVPSTTIVKTSPLCIKAL